MELRKYQLDALGKMKTGCILCGGVGSGKSLTSLSYFYLKMGGDIRFLTGDEEYIPMDNTRIEDLYIITTARKRDTFEWDKELIPFLLSRHKEENLYCNKVIVDSWNNIKKYKDVRGAFFIFDEQRVVGSGTWVKSFLKITDCNDWILLSATPGDTWSDYIPVFVANGFYRNRTEFLREHAVYSRFAKFPKIEKYISTGKLLKYRNDILVDMDFKRETNSVHRNIAVSYDKLLYREVNKSRFDPYLNEPILNAGGLCYVLRKIVNSDISRGDSVLRLLEEHPKAIIFYNFDYELDILRGLTYSDGTEIAEWNGHKHEPIPVGDKWVYLVQYTAGNEGWNCIMTDTIIFYSQNYSYKVMVQAAGRIDRMNTPFKELYYYHLMSGASIDLAISVALKKKKKFNERDYVKW